MSDALAAFNVLEVQVTAGLPGPPGSKGSDGRDGSPDTPYLAVGSSIARNSIARVGDRVNAKDYALSSGVTVTTDVEAWLDKVGENLQTAHPVPLPEARAGYIPAGKYTSAGTVFETPGYNFTISGDGWESQLENVQLDLTYHFAQVADLQLIGNAVDIGVNFRGVQGLAANVKVYDRDIGFAATEGGPASSRPTNNLILAGMAQNCRIGIQFGDDTGLIHPADLNAINTQIVNSDEDGVLFLDGGQLKLLGVRSNGAMGRGIAVLGDATHAPNESYYCHVTATNNAEDPGDVGRRVYNITGIVTHSAGARIEVTFDADHTLSPGTGHIQLAGTGIAAYDDFTTFVYDVTGTDTVVLNMPFAGAGDPGSTLSADGWDWYVESVGSNAFVRGQWHTGGNYNYLYFSGGQHMTFANSRTKTQIWFDDAQQPSGILFIGGVDGEWGGATTGGTAANNTERRQNILPYGPGADRGWGRLGMFSEGFSGVATGSNLSVGVLMPFTAGGLIAGVKPADYNWAKVFSDHVELRSNGNTFSFTSTTLASGSDLLLNAANGAAATAGSVATLKGGQGGTTGAGGPANLTAGASGTGATGNGGTATVRGGAAASTNGNGGPVILVGGALAGTGKQGSILHRSIQSVLQAAPVSLTTSTTLTAANLTNGLLLSNQGAGAAATYTLPEAADLDAQLPDFVTNDAFEFSLTVTSTVAAETATLATNTGWTLNGNMGVSANTAITAQSAGRFRARRSGAATWTLTRIG